MAVGRDPEKPGKPGVRLLHRHRAAGDGNEIGFDAAAESVTFFTRGGSFAACGGDCAALYDNTIISVDTAAVGTTVFARGGCCPALCCDRTGAHGDPIGINTRAFGLFRSFRRTTGNIQRAVAGGSEIAADKDPEACTVSVCIE